MRPKISYNTGDSSTIEHRPIHAHAHILLDLHPKQLHLARLHVTQRQHSIALLLFVAMTRGGGTHLYTLVLHLAKLH